MTQTLHFPATGEMPVAYQIEAASKLVIITCSGEFSIADLRANTEAILQDPAVSADYPVLIRGIGAKPEFSTDDILAHAKWRKQQRRVPRMALVAATEFEFGMARMYELASGSAAAGEIQVFRSKAEARAWLGVPRA